MLLQFFLTSLLASFSSVTTNISSYDYHSTFEYYRSGIIVTYEDYGDEYSVYANCGVRVRGDLFFNGRYDSEQLGGHEYYFSVSEIRFDCNFYYNDSLNDSSQIGNSYYVTYSVPDYVADGTSTFLYNKSDGTGNFQQLRADLFFEVDTSNLYFTLNRNPYNEPMTFIWSSYVSYPEGEVFDDESHALLSRYFRFSLPDNLYSYIDSVVNSGAGYHDGYSAGYENGFNDGVNAGYNDGYHAGFSDGLSTNSTAFTIFNGILQIALVPINFFLAIFNWEILGINIAEFISALLSVCCLLILLRVVFAGGSKGE